MADKKRRDHNTIMARHIARFVRNTDDFELLHSGISPKSKTGDFSDVKVISPYGEVPWIKVSRFSDKEMRTLMLAIEQQIIEALKAYKNWEENYNKEKLGVESEVRFEEFLEDMLFNKSSASWDLPKED